MLALDLRNLNAYLLWLFLIVLAILDEVSALFLLCEDTDILVVFHTVWEHLEIEAEFVLSYVLNNFVEFALSLLCLTSDPSQVGNGCLRTFLDENLRPKVLHKRIREELVTQLLSILFEDIDEYICLKTRKLVWLWRSKFGDYAGK